MKTFSYTKSQYLIEELNKIDNLRQTLLLTPLSLHDKLLFRWNAYLDRIFYSLNLSGVEVTRNQIIELLSPLGKSRLTSRQKTIVGFKKALDYLVQEWLVSSKTVNESALIKLNQLLTGTKNSIENSDLPNSLRYIQASPDHAVIQAGLAQILLQSENFFGDDSSQVASLTSTLFLYKYGYDFRRFIAIEEYFYTQRDRYNKLINQSIRDVNVTPWLEFVVEATEYQLNKILKQISSREYEATQEKQLLDLNERQKNILSFLDQPSSKINNKTVQKMFKISAITAARDLAKLTSLGLLFTVGKGRSTYYTKA